MKNLTWIVGLVFVLAVSGCNLKQKMEEKAEEAAAEAIKEAVEEAAGTAAEEEAAEEEAAVEEADEEEADEMAVAKEDLDKAIEIYKIMHNDDLTVEAKDKKFKEMLEENDWDKESFEDIIYSITQDPPSRAYYNENIEAE
ncbi:MAG: hypothetical protein JRG91_00385 [Deltaproteobacteria bacterium]|nr:hypothetical protein [Deltaproteobacteria bacterium]